MNIAFVAPQISRTKGGIQNMSFLFAEEFPRYMKFHTFCANDSDTFTDCERFVTYSKYNQKQTIRIHYDLIKQIIKKHRKEKYDFVLSSLYSYGLGGLLLKKMWNIPYGIMVHGNELLDEPRRETTWGRIIAGIKKKVRRIILKNSDLIIANSEFTKKLVSTRYQTRRALVIHPPIRFVDHHVADAVREKQYVLFSIGRVVKRKGFQFVIEALKDLKNDFPKIKYYIAGTGPYLDVLKQYTLQSGINDMVVFCGKVDEEEKARLYKKCDYFIMPSYGIETEGEIEGFGIVYIEANMYGKYVIASRSGGAPDAVIEGETGCFVEPENVGSVRETIRKLYDDSFQYSPQKCVEWAKKMDVHSVANLYIQEIQDIQMKEFTRGQ